MIPLKEILIAMQGTLTEWWRVRWSDLQFAEGETAVLVLVVLVALALVILLAQTFRPKHAGGRHIALPAILPVMVRSSMSPMRHAAFVLFLLGVPFFAAALGDPRTAFTREDVTYPGRRIAMLIDGSSSMIIKFQTAKLKTADQRAFYTAVAAAEYFMKRRMDGPYRDLVALIEFGNEAYVITPFTTDYESVLLGLKLIGQPRAYGTFNDSGTTIIKAFEQTLFPERFYFEHIGRGVLAFVGDLLAFEIDGDFFADLGLRHELVYFF